MARAQDTGLSRRELVAGAAALGVAGWLFNGVLGPESASAEVPLPPDLPAGVGPYRAEYRNWSGEIHADQLWTCAPDSPEQVARLADWARAHGWRLRAQGHRHTWAPLTVPPGLPAAAQVLLVDTTRHLTALTLVDGSTVRAQTGADMEALLAFLADRGLGVAACPAPGELTVGGVLAIGGHGTAVPPAAGQPLPGHGYGTVSNQVVRFTAVVLDPGSDRYVLRTFDRSEPDAAAFLVHLGRAFLTEVELRVGPDQRLRCLSRTDIPAAELLAPPGAGGRSLASLVDGSGRVEVIWYAFTEQPWVKVWSAAPARPVAAREVREPYNYPFSDRIPEPVARLAGEILAGAWGSAPLFGQLQYLVTKIGLTGDLTDLLLGGGLLRDLLSGDALVHLLADGLRSDLWGPSRTLLQYVRPSTLRVTANGYAVLARRADLQWVVGEFAAYYRALLGRYQARGEFPVNGGVEIRVTGLDDPAPVGVAGARAPLLSALRPRTDRPEWDTAVWLDVLTLPGTPGMQRFCRELEQYLLRTFDGTRAGLRVEWSKGWGYTDTEAWADPDVLGRAVPASLGEAGGWAEAVAVLDRHDPDRVFSNAFLDRLLR
ncbi:cholesterol oxidase substrate-binding domain-containing protein [Kitasatospora sp. NPDC094015]|uniref:cholesterol oxidase substrate-binding domain-containing protein n=1 Tax=Kitasatospora sp. NPDC094015 TaxID=3155205 RepID=UPI0033224112